METEKRFELKEVKAFTLDEVEVNCVVSQSPILKDGSREVCFSSLGREMMKVKVRPDNNNYSVEELQKLLRYKRYEPHFEDLKSIHVAAFFAWIEMNPEMVKKILEENNEKKK